MNHEEKRARAWRAEWPAIEAWRAEVLAEPADLGPRQAAGELLPGWTTGYEGEWSGPSPDERRTRHGHEAAGEAEYSCGCRVRWHRDEWPYTPGHTCPRCASAAHAHDCARLRAADLAAARPHLASLTTTEFGAWAREVCAQAEDGLLRLVQRAAEYESRPADARRDAAHAAMVARLVAGGVPPSATDGAAAYILAAIEDRYQGMEPWDEDLAHLVREYLSAYPRGGTRRQIARAEYLRFG